MHDELRPTIEHLPKSFENMVLSELGAKSLEEISGSLKNNTWPYKIQPKELWKKIADYFGQPISMEDIGDLLTGDKTEEEIKTSIQNKKWPFAIREEDMRKSIENLKKEQEPIPKDISEEFKNMPPHEFHSFFRTLKNEPSLSITIDWKSWENAIRLKAFLEDSFLLGKQKRSATIRATEEQYKQALNVFASGVKWEKV